MFGSEGPEGSNSCDMTLTVAAVCFSFFNSRLGYAVRVRYRRRCAKGDMSAGKVSNKTDNIYIPQGNPLEIRKTIHVPLDNPAGKRVARIMQLELFMLVEPCQVAPHPRPPMV